MNGNSFADAISKNKAVSVLIAGGIVLTALIQFADGMAAVDSWVMTHEEHDASLKAHAQLPHRAAQAQIDELTKWNKCERYERLLETLQDRKWRIEYSGRTEDSLDDEALRDVERDIRKLEKEFEAFDCVKVLAT